MEKYLNSVIQQDYCAFKFYERYKKFSPENSHLVILSDTSQPVGFHGSVHLKKHTFNENYLTPFVYIPPRKESDKFRIGEIIYELSYAQSDLVATIFDLLNGKAKQNSFAFALRKSTDRGLFAKLGMKPAAPSYENCHVLSQPYGGGEIGVVRNDDKYVYFVKKKKVTHYNIKDDLLEQNPKVISEDLSYEDFYNNYYCERFKY